MSWAVSPFEAAVAEVDAAGQLAHHEQVGALDPLALERARVEQRRAGPHRAQVGEQAEPLAQAEQALLGARLRRVGGVPLGAADGGEQHGVGAAAGVEHLVGQRGAVRVDRGAAERAARRARSRPARASTRSAAAMISGPMPSPGRVTIRAGMRGRARLAARAPRMTPTAPARESPRRPGQAVSRGRNWPHGHARAPRRGRVRGYCAGLARRAASRRRGSRPRRRA